MKTFTTDKVSLSRRANLLAASFFCLLFATIPAGVRAHGEHGDDDHPKDRESQRQVMWVNHFDLLSGDEDNVHTSHDSTSSGVGGGLTGLVITSDTTGEVFPDGGNKVVHMALDLPKQTKITGVRVCYELSSTGSFISQIRLAQVQNPPSSAVVMHDDGTDLTDPGPICVSSNVAGPAIKAQKGPVLLSLRLNFGNTADKIVIRGLGLLVK
ncbi:MAG TPA: hypothetical protein VNL74_02940 [Methylococcus sp.]|nr:hypothetical protein [Methylococcus sp.]